MIQGVGERGFKPESSALPDWKDLRQARGDGDRSGTLQDTDARVPDSSRTRRRWSERIEVPLKIALGRKPGFPTASGRAVMPPRPTMSVFD